MNKTLRNLALVALVAAPFSAFAEMSGKGTATEPYQVATAEDLQSCWTIVKAADTAIKAMEDPAAIAEAKKNVIYFVQTEDIDLAGAENWHAFVGYDNVTYYTVINYDGRNHIIDNFSPANEGYDASKANCYNGSIFGVLNGVVKNLGITNVNINTPQGGGAVCGYAGHSTGTKAVIENVYATGSVKGTSYLGGLCGTTGNDVEIKNCFVNITLESTGYTAPFIGRIRNAATINNAYAAGTVAGENAALAVSSDKTNIALNIKDVVLFNTGADGMPETIGCTVTGQFIKANTEGTKDAGIAAVKTWPAFSATETVDGLPALNYAFSGSGTENDPYIIATKDDLCNAWTKVDTYIEGTEVWFKQTADIDMEGVDHYTAISGWGGGNTVPAGHNDYFAVIHYDGQNHVIENFAPEHRAEADNYGYYCTSIFGVPAGSISNLGVIGATVTTSQGAGILGAYAGHGSSTSLTVENVFVEGEVTGTGSYTGGMFGTTGNEVTIKNSFANVTVTGADATYTAGLIGRQRNNVSVTNAYVAGSVKAGANAALVASTDGKTPTFNATNFIAFNTGATATLASTIVLAQGAVITVATEDTKDSLIEEVQNWRGGAFSETKYLKGYPILAAFEEYGSTSGIFEAAVEVEEADAPAVYYNLQGVQVANPDNGIYIVRRGNKVTKELIRK